MLKMYIMHNTIEIYVNYAYRESIIENYMRFRKEKNDIHNR